MQPGLHEGHAGCISHTSLCFQAQWSAFRVKSEKELAGSADPLSSAAEVIGRLSRASPSFEKYLPSQIFQVGWGI
jgi:hypothetical protein